MAKRTDKRAAPSEPSESRQAKRPDAVTENTIRPRNPRRPVVPPPGRRAAPSKSETEQVSAARKAAPSQTAPVIPPEIWERFIGIGAKYYFPDGTPAFVDRGLKLTTPSENTEVIRSLVSIAQARGWNHITVTGSERFRKEAWFAAHRVGIEVWGTRLRT